MTMYSGDPPYDFPAYRSTALRHPKQPLIQVGPERGGPALSHLRPGEISNDLGRDYYTRLDPDKHSRRLVAQLERLGFTVTLQEATA